MAVLSTIEQNGIFLERNVSDVELRGKLNRNTALPLPLVCSFSFPEAFGRDSHGWGD